MERLKPLIPKSKAAIISESQYQILAARRQTYDAMMWQTPVISLTGQAFLFTIALGTGTAPTSRLISGFLAFIAAISSLQLMAKHRAFEIADSNELERYENANQMLPIHAHRDPMVSSDKRLKAWIVRRSSYKLWMICLGMFGMAAAGVVALTVLGTGHLK